MFENPFLNLSDIHIPVVEFEAKAELFDQVPDLIEGLAGNLSGPEDEERSVRLEAAWTAYDDLYDEEQAEGTSNKIGAPSSEIRSSIEKLHFEPRHIAQWPVWSGESEHGTALLVSGINYDLQVQLETEIADSSARAARERFFETLSSFVDPFVDPKNSEARAVDLDFAYAVRTWHRDVPDLVVGSEKQFDRRLLDGLEHQIIGTVDADGVFEGRVKAFGHWVEETCRIEPPARSGNPKASGYRSRSVRHVHRFDGIRVRKYDAAEAGVPALSGISRALFRLHDLSRRITRSSLWPNRQRFLRNQITTQQERWPRILEDHRQMFGRLAITRRANPNLKDKAGREGLLDNRAAKTLKLIVANILSQSARRYFGSASPIRSEVLPQVKASNKAERATTERNKLRQRQRKEFRSKLDRYVKELPALVDELEDFAQHLDIADEAGIADAQAAFESYKDSVTDFRLSGAPKNLGSLEDKYADYRNSMRSATTLIETAAIEIERTDRGDQPHPAPRAPRKAAGATFLADRASYPAMEEDD